MITKAQFHGVACALVFIGTVIACLWPFHSPQNQVSWLKQGNGVRFDGHATIISRGAILLPGQPPVNSWTLEIWLRPGEAYQSNTILAFYNPQRSCGLLLRQWNTDFVAESRLWRKVQDDETAKLELGRIFRRKPLLFLTLVSGSQGTSAYVDGKLVKVKPELQIPSEDLSGQLVLANSPVDSDSWSGELRGLALYGRELNEAQILRHFATWNQTGQPSVTEEEAPVALYLFSEKSGSVIHNQVVAGAALYVPNRFLEVHQAFLKRPWDEYRPDSNYWKNVVLNIAGFVPLGFFLYGYLSLALRVRRAALVTILIGGLLSLGVETLQAFLPTRDSGMTDIITNTLGTALGAWACVWASIISERLIDSRHLSVRLLAALFIREGRESEVTAGPTSPNIWGKRSIEYDAASRRF